MSLAPLAHAAIHQVAKSRRLQAPATSLTWIWRRRSSESDFGLRPARQKVQGMTREQRRVLSLEGGNLVIQQTNPGRGASTPIKVVYKKKG